MTAPAPSFDHRHDGTEAAQWDALVDGLPAGADVGAHDHVALLVAHPDDETLGAGGLLAEAAAIGAQLTVIVATDGEASHPDSPTHDGPALARLRTAELVAAVRRVAPGARVVRLGLPDGRVAEHREELLRRARDDAAGATVLVTTWVDDGHPDHETCGLVAAQLARDTGARMFEFPVWAWTWGRPGDSGPLRGDGWVRRPVGPPARAAKAAALREHRSQVVALSAAAGDEPVLRPAMLEHFDRRVEVFRVGMPVDLPAGYFERLYAADPDPWRLASRFYERRKRDLLIAALPRERFARAFEPGCGPGLTSLRLAGRCDELVACDASPTAVAAARERLANCPNVDVSVGSVPESWPAGRFDLVVVSELGYYLADLTALTARIRAALPPDGVLVACHWRHRAPGYPTAAETVHATLGAGLTRLVSHVEEDFLLDVWSADPRSVAQLEGLLPSPVPQE